MKENLTEMARAAVALSYRLNGEKPPSQWRVELWELAEALYQTTGTMAHRRHDKGLGPREETEYRVATRAMNEASRLARDWRGTPEQKTAARELLNRW